MRIYIPSYVIISEYQSTKGGCLVIQIALKLTRPTSPCHNMHAHTTEETKTKTN